MPSRDAPCPSIHLIGIGKDVTYRHRIGKDLRESEAAFQSVDVLLSAKRVGPTGRAIAWDIHLCDIAVGRKPIPQLGIRGGRSQVIYIDLCIHNRFAFMEAFRPAPARYNPVTFRDTSMGGVSTNITPPSGSGDTCGAPDRRQTPRGEGRFIQVGMTST